MKMTKRVMRVPTPSLPLQVRGGMALSDSEKAEVLAESNEARFQPVDDRRTRHSLRRLMGRCARMGMRPQVNRH
jgi:hypothetical protein